MDPRTLTNEKKPSNIQETSPKLFKHVILHISPSQKAQTFGKWKLSDITNVHTIFFQNLVGPKLLASPSVSKTNMDFYDGGSWMILGNPSILKHK